ncbi:MAG: Gfo/Idh/MocA family protein [Candidatus Thorarchaeota archaeon]
MSKLITAILIGAGLRGMDLYGNYALKYPKKLKFLAVAEPIQTRREKFANLHKISLERSYRSWEELLDEDKLADVAFICTQDQMHVEPTLAALDKKYDVLLEKPMAHTLEGCVRIVQKAEETGKIVGISHVLRYTQFFSTIYNAIQTGSLGKIINISHRENVSWYHMAHSFVRGNWSNKQNSSPMILAKCCHDFDLLYWMIDSIPTKISSFGNLSQFKRENAPKGAPDYCIEGCPIENECLYYAPRIYIEIIPILQELEKTGMGFYKFIANLRKNHKKTLKVLSKIIPVLKQLVEYKDWPVSAIYTGQPEEIENNYSDEAKLQILSRSPYGKCVFKCDNDVVDHQVVNIEFENETTANLIMHGFSEREGRTIRIDGTKATLIGEFFDSGQKIRLFDHFSGKEEIIFTQKFSPEIAVHGGGDILFIDAFINSLQDNNNPQPLTNARASLESHLMAFAANESRINGIVIDMKKFREDAELSI